MNGQLFILPKEFIFEKIEDIYYSKIICNGNNVIIGTPFFSLFHTMFDKENKMLRFYPKNEKYIERGKIEEGEEEKKGEGEKEKGKGESEREIGNEGFKLIYLAYIIPPSVIFIAIIIVIICCVKMKKDKKANSFISGINEVNNDSIIN